MKRAFLVVLALFLPLVAVAGKPAEKAVAKHYAKVLGCSGNEVSATVVPGSYRRVGTVDIYDYEVRGCNQVLIADGYIWLGVLSLFDDVTVRRRAPVELNCPADQMELSYIDAKTRIASGCGGRITYLFVGEADDPVTTWTAQVVSSPAPSAQPAAVPTTSSDPAPAPAQ